MSGSEDRLLIERSLKGDRSAFDSLVRKHERRAYQYAYRLTSNPEEAADVVADTFIRVFSALPNFKGTSAFSTWLYRILTNCFLDLRKKEKSRAVTSLDTSSADEHFERQVEDEGPGPTQIAERDERERIM
ncbi:MAG: sigma-70 family RNA polymerase sigma factor, partial [Fimbriimonadaceae bacterium]